MRLICSLLNSGLNYLRSKWIKQKHERKSILYAVCVCARGSIQNVLFFAVKPLCLVKKRATLCSHYVHDCCQNKRGKRRCYTWTRTCCVYSKVNHINTRRCLRHGDECTLLSLSPLVGGTVPPPFFFTPSEYSSMVTSSTPTFFAQVQRIGREGKDMGTSV